MIVSQFSTFPYGGAGTAAVRHHLEMRRQGIDSRFFHRSGLNWSSGDLSFREAPFEKAVEPGGFFAARREKNRRRRIVQQYEKHLRVRSAGLELFSQAELIEPTQIDPSKNLSSVIHLHWVPFLVDIPSFFASIPTSTPVVWTLHDMNPFTGGCHYSDGCGKFTTGCGHCPEIEQPSRRDVSFTAMRSKKLAFAEHRFHVVTPSRWLNRLAQQSPVWPTGTQFHTIANGLDTSLFRPIDKSAARKQLGLPQNVTLIAFGAEDVENPRKGFHSLLHSLRLLYNEKPIECIVFGRGRLPDQRDGLPNFHEFGFVDQPELQATIYAAADIYVLPSIEDNAPQTGLEAMACGTPVVAYEAGGIPEFVMPGQTGLLAAVGNVSALAKQISDLAEHDRLRQRLSAGARKLIESQFDVRKQARMYIDLYRAITAISDSKPVRRAA